jgi:high-affinity Fe2+/Pb2+ permease
VERLFALAALPAFVIGLFITFGLGTFGINEVLSYMISMPLLISAWFYFVGWLIDRWRFKRSHLNSAPVADKS